MLKKIWITGASSGIGKSLAIKFAKEGWQVAASARRENLLQDLNKNNSNIHPFPLDVIDETRTKKVFKEISYISGLLPKNNFRKAKNYINSDNIFQTLKKYQPSHILLKITMEEIKNYFTQSSQLNNFFDLQYNYKPLKFCSEFSLTLIKEKPKLKINSPI